MAVSKVSLSIDEEVLAEARERAGRRELSSYVTDALRRQLQHDRIGELLAEMEAESGPIPQDLMEEARQPWRGPGAAREVGVEVGIPSVVIAETVLGSARDASVNRVIKAIGEVTATVENTGRTAGALLGAARSTSTVDALVVASAIEVGGAVVLTGDPDDLQPLADGHPEVVISPL
ncbi:MAG: hypothetical protein AB7O92_16695 [Acidimicrobiia bacterium]